MDRVLHNLTFVYLFSFVFNHYLPWTLSCSHTKLLVDPWVFGFSPGLCSTLPLCLHLDKSFSSIESKLRQCFLNFPNFRDSLKCLSVFTQNAMGLLFLIIIALSCNYLLSSFPEGKACSCLYPQQLNEYGHIISA